MFVGASARTGRGHREGGPPRAGRDRPDPARRAADRSPYRDDPRCARRGGRRRGNARGPGPCRHRDGRVLSGARRGGGGTGSRVGQDVPERPGWGGDDRHPTSGDPREGEDHAVHGRRTGREERKHRGFFRQGPGPGRGGDRAARRGHRGRNGVRPVRPEGGRVRLRSSGRRHAAGVPGASGQPRGASCGTGTGRSKPSSTCTASAAARR